MNTPFTTDQFFEVFRKYNQSVFPMQVVFFILAIVALYLTFNTTAKSSRIITLILVSLWLWMGIVYHFVFFVPINKLAIVFGILFILQAILFIYYGVIKSLLAFKFNQDIFGITGMIIIFFALFVYPVLGYLLGHIYPQSPTFGLPCPSTIFSFGMFLLTSKKFPTVLIIIPFIWSVIGLSAVFNFKVYEDSGLLIAGLITASLLLIKNKDYVNY